MAHCRVQKDRKYATKLFKGSFKHLDPIKCLVRNGVWQPKPLSLPKPKWLCHYISRDGWFRPMHKSICLLLKIKSALFPSGETVLISQRIWILLSTFSVPIRETLPITCQWWRGGERECFQIFNIYKPTFLRYGRPTFSLSNFKGISFSRKYRFLNHCRFFNTCANELTPIYPCIFLFASLCDVK